MFKIGGTMSNFEMKINSIEIENYKSIKKIKINSLSDFNVIIGENNIGKSSIFEALLLWKQCYDCSILAKGKGFYKLTKDTFRYLLFDDLEFLRVKDDIDLFNDSSKPIIIKLNIQIKKDSIDDEYPLGFYINRNKNPSNAYLRVQYIEYNDFENFNNAIDKKPREAIYIYKTQPVSTILAKEPFMTNGQILKKISRGKSYEVLRNKIIKKDNNIDIIAQKATRVLDNEIKLKLNNKKSDEYIDLIVTINNKEVDIHLQGSGLLQILEIFSSIEYFESALNIVLLDEPDAHIHTMLQRNLINTLKEDDEKNQIFVISHNEKFVDSLVDNTSLYYLNKYVKNESHELDILDKTSRIKIKRDLGSIITTLEEIQDASKIILVEGTGDIGFFNLLIDKYFDFNDENKKNKNIHFIQVRGKDKLKDKIDFLVQLIPQLLVDKKIGVICDKDFTTSDKLESHRSLLLGSLKRYKDFVYFHPSYCLETTLLTDESKLLTFIAQDININIESVQNVYDEYFNMYISNVKDVTREEHSHLLARFNSQKNNREELKDLTVQRVIGDLTTSGIPYLINKQLLTEFLRKIGTMFSGDIEINHSFNYIEGTSSDFLNYYAQNITRPSQFYDCHKELVEKIFDIE